jgi:hypothetical protein
VQLCAHSGLEQPGDAVEGEPVSQLAAVVPAGQPVVLAHGRLGALAGSEREQLAWDELDHRGFDLAAPSHFPADLAHVRAHP